MKKDLLNSEDINSEIVRRINLIDNCDSDDKSKFNLKDYIFTVVIIVIALAIIIYGAFL